MADKPTDRVQVRPEIQALLTSLRTDDPALPLAFSAEAYAEGRRTLFAFPEGERTDLAVHMVAVALRFKREAPTQTRQVVEQLYALAFELAGSRQRLEAALVNQSGRLARTSESFREFSADAGTSPLRPAGDAEGTQKASDLMASIKLPVRG